MATHTKFIPLARPDINEDDIALVANVLRSGMLVQGHYVNLLEQAFASYIHVKHAIAVSNGTASLHLALKALSISEGDEVIVPAFSYPATANVVELVGAKCVFIDIDEQTFNIDVSKIEAAITDKTKAIIPVHEFGLCCDIESIMRIASARNIAVIEDAACALGARQNGKMAGSFGTMGSFSLHPRKSITSGEGGVITTNDDTLAQKLRQLRNHGIEVIAGKMAFVEAGLNYRITDFQAALAWSQFQRLESILETKQQLSEQYFIHINNSNLLLPIIPEDRNHTWQTFHMLVKNSNRDELIESLKEKNIGSNYGAQCIPAQPYYYNKYKLESHVQFPNAFNAFNNGLAIPLYERLQSKDINFIAETINQL